jgi:hypothetical protein
MVSCFIILLFASGSGASLIPLFAGAFSLREKTSAVYLTLMALTRLSFPFYMKNFLASHTRRENFSAPHRIGFNGEFLMGKSGENSAIFCCCLNIDESGARDFCMYRELVRP